MKNKYSIVIPCYKSATTIEKVVMLTVEELKRIKLNNYEFVLVNDCSPDNRKTLTVLFELADKYSYIKVVNLAKNVGQHNAIMAGLHYSTGDFIIAMDDDFQTHPSQISKLIDEINKGYDIVYGYYEQKKESFFRRLGSAVNHITVCLLLHKPKWLKTSSFWIIRRYIRDYLVQYTLPNIHLQGLFLRTTESISCVPIEHFNRAEGTSGYTLKKLFRLYANIISYSVVPLQIITRVGGILAVGGFIVDATIIVRKLLNPSVLMGWSSIMGAICFFSGIILIAMGTIGTYIGRLFSGMASMPQFVVKDVRNIDTFERKEK